MLFVIAKRNYFHLMLSLTEGRSLSLSDWSGSVSELRGLLCMVVVWGRVVSWREGRVVVVDWGRVVTSVNVVTSRSVIESSLDRGVGWISAISAY